MMHQEMRSVDYGSKRLTYGLSFSARKSLAITVHPDGSVSATAPADSTPAEIDRRVRGKARWITEKQLEYARYVPQRASQRLYVSGSLHPYLGRRHRLRLRKAGEWSLALRNGVFELQGPDTDDAAAIHRVFHAWYANRAKSVFAEQIEKGAARFPSRSAIAPQAMSLRTMERRWGSMTPSGRLLLNPRLIEHAKPLIEYVITHELAHRIVPDHSSKFWGVLQRAMPDWRTRKDRLEGVRTS